MGEVEIRKALEERRWETARRQALAALKKDETQNEIRLLLHKACRRLGDYATGRRWLESLVPVDEGQHLEVELLLGEDYTLLADYGHYRGSAEARAGLSGDEYVEKYTRLSRERLEKAGTLVRTGEQRIRLEALKARCSRNPHVGHSEAPALPTLPDEGTGRICGSLTYSDGRPAADLRLVLGLEVPLIERDPSTYTEAQMHYHPVIGGQRSRETRTDHTGSFRFADLPAGRHEFIAVSLDPLQDEIGTHFLAHDIWVEDGAEVSLSLLLTPWKSVAPVPVLSPFAKTQNLLGIPARLVHREVMRNPFHYDFPRQMVSFALPQGVPADPGRLCLLCSSAPGEPVAFQVDGDELSFFAELPPLSDRVYALYLAEEGRFSSEQAAALQPEVAPDGRTATLSTGRSSFRIAWGEGSDAASPVQAVRGEDGCWRGAGRWVLPAGVSVTGWRSRVLAQGPLSVTVALEYHFTGGARYEIRLTAQRGEATLLVHEISPGLEGAAFEFSLAEFSGGRGFLHWCPENGGVHWSDLSAEPRELARLQESVAWWIPPEAFGYAMTAGGLEQKDYIGVVTLRRGEWVDRLFAKISQGPGDDRRELDWPFPEMVGSTVSMITAHTSPSGDAFFRFACFDGERRWGLLVSTFDRNDGLWKEVSSVQHKNSSPRLQEFKEWHLDEEDRVIRPFVITRRERLIALRKKGEDPLFAPLRERLRGWKQMGTDYDRLGSRGLDAVLDGDPLKLWALKKEIDGVAAIRSRMTLLGRDYSDMYSPVGGRPITPWAEVYDLIAATGVFSAAEERRTRAFLVLMGHLYMQTDLMNWRFNSRNANFEADRVDIVGSVGLAFHGNPDSGGMIDHAVSLMQRSLEVYCTPGSGKWYENPACYYLHAANCRLNLAFHLWEHGIFDSTAIGRLKDFLSWALHLATPPYATEYALLRDGCDEAGYARAHKVRRMPPIGDHALLGKWFSEYFALMAKAFRERDPEFAEKLFWLYQAGGSHGGHFSRHALFFASMEEEDLRPARAPVMVSRRLEGFGSVFRGQVGEGDEFYLLFKLGPGGYRYHRSEGSLLLISGGQPIIFDGGEAGETWRHTTLSFGETHMPLAAGHLERFHTFSPLDFSQGVNPKALQPGEPVFLSDKCDHQLVEVALARFNEPHPANSRSVLWVKDEYLVLHDQLNLPEGQLTHWHLQAVADSHEGSWREGFRFKGRYGTDLQVELPGQEFSAEVVTQQPMLEYRLKPEETFAMRHLQLSATQPDHLLAVLRPLRGGKAPVQSELLFAKGKVQGCRVTGEDLDDLHWLDRNGVEAVLDGVRFTGRYGSLLRRGALLHLVIQDGSLLEAGRLRLTSTGPAVSLTVDGDKATLQAEGRGQVEVLGLAVPCRLNLEGERVEVKLG